MYKRNGITLIVLILTIVVLLIIAGVSINYGINTMDTVDDDIKKVSLNMVQQALIQQYSLLVAEERDGIVSDPINEDVLEKDDSLRSNLLAGTRIADTSSLNELGFSSYKISYSSGENGLAYEEYYYILDNDALNEIGVESDNSNSTMEYNYVVNYSTGEVYDVINKEYSTSDDEIYLKGTIDAEDTKYVFSD